MPPDQSSATCATLEINRETKTVCGIRCAVGSPLFVERFVSTTFGSDSEISLAVAEVVAGLGRPPAIGIISDFASGRFGTADGTADAAQAMARTSGQPIRFATTLATGDIVPAHDVDRLLAIVEGAGFAVARIETTATARYRAVGTSKPRRRIQGCTIPNSLFEAEAATPEQLAPLVGAALGLVSYDPAGDLRPSVAQTASPSGSGAAGLGWSVEPTTVPLEFTRTTPTDPVELHYTMLAHAVSMLALALLIVLL